MAKRNPENNIPPENEDPFAEDSHFVKGSIPENGLSRSEVEEYNLKNPVIALRMLYSLVDHTAPGGEDDDLRKINLEMIDNILEKKGNDPEVMKFLEKREEEKKKDKELALAEKAEKAKNDKALAEAREQLQNLPAESDKPSNEPEVRDSSDDTLVGYAFTPEQRARLGLKPYPPGFTPEGKRFSDAPKPAKPEPKKPWWKIW